MKEQIEGNLIIIGGAEDKLGDKKILKEVAKYIDKETGNMVIATVATEYPEETYKKYYEIFKNIGIKNINKLDIATRKDAFDISNINLVEECDLLFFTGGDQLRITSILGGTDISKAIRDIVNKGKVIAGTSAGASVMSDTMIVKGEDDESPRKCTLNMSPGLALVKNIIIDQHFAQRGRIGRLLTAIAQNPEVLGMGIDEDTAIVLNDKGIGSIIGSGAIYFIDGSAISYTITSEQNSEEVLSMFNVKLHVLKEGNKFDLIKKVPFEEAIKADENLRN